MTTNVIFDRSEQNLEYAILTISAIHDARTPNFKYL